MSSTTGSSPPPSNVTPDDHEPYLVIVCGIGLAWAILSYVIRIYVRTSIKGPFGIDDAIITLGTLVGACQTATVLVGVHNGLGENQDLLSNSQIERALHANYAAELLYIVTICLTKCSVALLIARFTKVQKHIYACYVVLVISLLWGTVSTFVIAFQCTMANPWDIQNKDHCTGLFTRWLVIEVWSMIIEFMLLAVVLFLVWSLHTSWKNKITVCAAFTARLLIILPTVFRLVYLHQYFEGSDVTFDAIGSVISTLVVMHFSLMAATIPCMRPFFTAFNSEMIKMHEPVEGWKNEEGIILPAYDSDGSNRQLPSSGGGGYGSSRDRLADAKNTESLTERPAEARSVASDASGRMMIRKTLAWEVRSTTE